MELSQAPAVGTWRDDPEPMGVAQLGERRSNMFGNVSAAELHYEAAPLNRHQRLIVGWSRPEGVSLDIL